MKVFITGGSGFIGSHLMPVLGKKYVQNYDLVNGDDIRNYKQLVLSMAGADAVVHLAALVKVAECELHTRETIDTNSIGTMDVLEASRANDIENIIFTSSAAVYGEQRILPVKEDAQLHPASTYAISKIASERAIESYREKYDLNITTFRIFNVYGPGQDPNSPYSAAIPRFVKRALKGQDLIIYGDGKQTRDFIYIRDVVDAIHLALQKRPNQTLNLASGKDISVLDLANKICMLTNSDSNIEFEKARTGDLKYSYADIAKLKDFGFTPRFDLETGLKETMQFFKTAK